MTDRRRFDLSTSALIDRAQWAAESGVDLIQVRERDLTDRELADLVRAIVGVVSGSRARVVVNDRVDIARVAGAAGVHLRGDSISISDARSLVPSDFVIGRSVHTLHESQAAAAEAGLDYLLFGTVFPSGGKPEGHIVAGLDALAAVCRSVTCPVLAIGGIDEQHARAASDAGAAGVAAVELFMSASTASTMRARVEGLRRAFDSTRSGSPGAARAVEGSR